ncbi:VWA domain-containing protein [Micromonospora ureilytica]|uniref:vWA domain-containing protein n=1 Tax=Micromonospora ureilytica TaxID=709868 RepID=UPI002E0F427B|nr:VWA domain-containing protein [Micromonospora ureilytica]
MVLSVAGQRAAAEDDTPARVDPSGLVEVLVIDCSGSMADPPTKMVAAQQAAAAAIAVLPDGVRFAVIQGTSQATVVYPATGTLATASPTTRKEASAAVARLSASGGTAIGSWLAAARDLLPSSSSTINHVLLLTDGINEHETEEELARVLRSCAGRFGCDPRGIGAGWHPADLLRIAAVLHGTAEAVRRPADLSASFRESVLAALTKLLPDVRIRLRTMPYAELAFFKQSSPTIQDLTEYAERVDERTWEFATGSWGAERRDFHLCLRVEAPDDILEQDRLAARVDLVVDGDLRATTATVLVNWTVDMDRSARIDLSVSQLTGQEDVRQAINAGCDAYDRGDRAEAHAQWTQAVALASETRDEAALEQLRHLVDIEPGGLVRLKQNLSQTDIKVSIVGSMQNPVHPPVPRGPADADKICGACLESSPPGSEICENCGKPFTGDPQARVPA